MRPPPLFQKKCMESIIENLIDQNEEAVKLIIEYAGETVHPDFRKACDKFLDYANNWSAV